MPNKDADEIPPKNEPMSPTNGTISKRKFHLPTINFQVIDVSFQGVNLRSFLCVYHSPCTELLVGVANL